MPLLSTNQSPYPHCITPPIIPSLSRCEGYLTRATLEGLSEEKDLELIVDGQDTGSGNTTENVGTSTLEERLDALLGDDLASSVYGTVVLDGLTGRHHHTTSDSVKRV